jgi:hypothetical protein
LAVQWRLPGVSPAGSLALLFNDDPAPSPWGAPTPTGALAWLMLLLLALPHDELKPSSDWPCEKRVKL